MSITRWEPLRDMIGLREAMDSLLEQSFVRPGAEAGHGAFGLAVDVEDRGDAYIIEAAAPGMRPEDVDVAVMGDVVRIRAERRDERQQTAPDRRMLVREQRFGVFERALQLPTPVAAGEAQAEFRDGVLVITLPKAEASRERRIPVRAGNGQMGAESAATRQTDQTHVAGQAGQGTAITGQGQSRPSMEASDQAASGSQRSAQRRQGGGESPSGG